MRSEEVVKLGAEFTSRTASLFIALLLALFVFSAYVEWRAHMAIDNAGKGLSKAADGFKKQSAK